MVNLVEYEAYWRNMLVRVPEIKAVWFVTVDTDIQSIKSDIKPAQQPFMVVVIPSAISKGDYDNAEENNLGLLYLYSKEDLSKNTINDTFGIQKRLQPIIEQVKNNMREDKRTCNLMRGLDFETLQTDPERRMYSDLSGFSLSFQFESE